MVDWLDKARENLGKAKDAVADAIPDDIREGAAAARDRVGHEVERATPDQIKDGINAIKEKVDNPFAPMADRIRNLDDGVVRLDDHTPLTNYVQRALVKLGHNIGDGGPNGDGVDGDPGGLSIAAINAELRAQGVDGISSISEFNEEHLAAIHERLRDEGHFKGSENEAFSDEWKSVAQDELDLGRGLRGYFSDAADPDAAQPEQPSLDNTEPTIVAQQPVVSTGPGGMG